jgi:hypothetical protein
LRPERRPRDRATSGAPNAAELGAVGLVLLALFLGLPLVSLARRHGGMSTTAAAAYAAFLVHAGLDWDWEIPAVVVAGIACGAALLLGDGEQPKPPSSAARWAAALAAFALGAIGVAGARSTTVPAASATPRVSAEREKAPRRGAFSTTIPGPPAG